MRLLPVCFWALVLLTACKKEKAALRSKTYTLRAYNGFAVSGQVTFAETEAADSTLVKFEAWGLAHDTLYLTHLHTGTPGNLTGTLIYFNNIQTPDGHLVREQKWASGYNNALASNTCFTMHNPAFFSNDTIGYVLAGGTGANAQ